MPGLALQRGADDSESRLCGHFGMVDAKAAGAARRKFLNYYAVGIGQVKVSADLRSRSDCFRFECRWGQADVAIGGFRRRLVGIGIMPVKGGFTGRRDERVACRERIDVSVEGDELQRRFRCGVDNRVRRGATAERQQGERQKSFGVCLHGRECFRRRFH